MRLTYWNITAKLMYLTGACCLKPENDYLLPVCMQNSVLRAFN